jgi:hypothetical protein
MGDSWAFNPSGAQMQHGWWRRPLKNVFFFLMSMSLNSMRSWAMTVSATFTFSNFSTGLNVSIPSVFSWDPVATNRARGFGLASQAHKVSGTWSFVVPAATLSKVSPLFDKCIQTGQVPNLFLFFDALFFRTLFPFELCTCKSTRAWDVLSMFEMAWTEFSP